MIAVVVRLVTPSWHLFLPFVAQQISPAEQSLSLVHPQVKKNSKYPVERSSGQTSSLSCITEENKRMLINKQLSRNLLKSEKISVKIELSRIYVQSWVRLCGQKLLLIGQRKDQMNEERQLSLGGMWNKKGYIKRRCRIVKEIVTQKQRRVKDGDKQ